MNEEENKVDTQEQNIVNEEVNVESTPNPEVNSSNIEQEKKSKPIKTILFILIPILIIVVIAIVIFSFIPSPQKTIKNFISGYDNLDAEKVVAQMDYIGMSAFPYSYSNELDQEDYNDFLESYEEIQKEYEEDTENDYDDELKDTIDDLDSSFYELDKDTKKFEVKLEEIKSSEELFDDLYLVKAKVSVLSVPEDDSDEEIDESDIIDFYVYKNKIVSSDLNF